MTSRADVTVLRDRTGQVVTLARRDLGRFWATLDLTEPDTVRDRLLTYVPALTATYGGVASTVAADWYDGVRPPDAAGRYRAVTVAADTDAAAVGTVRYAAGHLYGQTPAAALPVLAGAVQRYVAGTGRRTVTSNVARDPAKPRYARVPQGLHTCAWCSLMASRGFVYHSEAAAGGDGHDYHDDCNCYPVADWSKTPAIAGYDPDRLDALSSEARDSPDGGNDDRSIAAAMRRLHPDLFTDGVRADA